MEALAPLRKRARALEARRVQEQEAAIGRWQESEKPALKEFAHTLKETEHIQRGEIAQLQARLKEFAKHELNHPTSSGGPQPTRVTAGFNVIRARAGPDGQPLATEALRVERQRLVDTLAQLNVQIAAAKAELTEQRRLEEQEIWETKLVALQDTKRVYREEVNLIEVELLGREHAERIQRDREQAELTGLARLTRLTEQALQTRIKYNRAKHQYYFPAVKGYNITFGGAGIFGACKDICISEITGSVNITAEAPAPNAAPNKQRARLVIQFESAKASRGGTVKRSDTQGLGASSAVGTVASSEGRPLGSSNGAPGHCPRTVSEPPLGRSHSTTGPRDREPAGSAARPQGSVRRSVTFPAAAPAHAAPTATAPRGSMEGPVPPTPPREPAVPAVPATGPKAKQKNMAMKFLSRLGSKKDKYHGKQDAALEPITEEPGSAGGAGGKRRSLASKLLSRRSSRAPPSRTHSNLDDLTFGSNAAEQAMRVADVAPDGLTDGGGSHQWDRSSDVSDTSPEPEGLADALDDAMRMARVSSRLEEHSEGDGSLASEDEEEDDEGGLAAAARAAASQPGVRQGALGDAFEAMSRSSGGRSFGGAGSSRGSWLHARPAAANGAATADGASTFDDGASSTASDLALEVEASTLPAGSGREGVYCRGRVSGFELVGERGTKVPNLSIGQGDVEANVYVRFVFEYTKLGGWRPADRPLFDVQHLKHRLRGNNVPMPATLIKHILRAAIPGLIQRKLLGVLPKELGEYLLAAKHGFEADADVAIVGPALGVLDADLAFEVRGPAKTSREARHQQHKHAAAKEARGMLGLSLPQAQVLGQLFNGPGALLDPPRPVSIAELIALQAAYDHYPRLYGQLCEAMGAAYQILVGDRPGLGGFDFRAFMDSAVTRVRRKPARARVTMRHMDVAFNVDAAITAVHDFTQRTIEELVVKGPVTNYRDNPEALQETLEEQLEVLHAWHAWLLNELSHFKSKFRGGGGTLLGAADAHGFSAGIEDFFYEGPLRLRLPVNMELDGEGAFSFEVPLPGPEGNLGKFMDSFKGLLVPSHLRPPDAAINWIPSLGDNALTQRMRRQVQDALSMIGEVLQVLNKEIRDRGLERQDEDPVLALAQPRTMVGDRLGRFIVSRLKARVLLDERRVGEILSGVDSSTMGAGFVTNAGRLLGHLGDLVTLAFMPVAGQGAVAGSSGQYLLQLESSDISRLRADVQTLGFQSLITPGGMVRLAHAVVQSFLLSFKEQTPEDVRPFVERMQGWYRLMTRRALEVSLCFATRGGVEGGDCVLRFSGTADDARVRETSPLVLTNDIDLVPLGKAMRGDPPPP